MTADVLDQRTLNRALLDRQLLLRRQELPAFEAIVLFHAGLACLVNALGFALVLPLHILVMQYGVIKHEERHLERVFGEEYRAYKARVRRWM